LGLLIFSAGVLVTLDLRGRAGGRARGEAEETRDGEEEEEEGAGRKVWTVTRDSDYIIAGFFGGVETCEERSGRPSGVLAVLPNGNVPRPFVLGACSRNSLP
jgi:hypothetical protein